MDISFIFLSLLAVLCVLSLICAVYFFLYKRHINKAFAAPETKHMKLVPPYKILVALVLVFIIVGVCFAITMLPSMKRLSTVSDIEKDIRNSQSIRDDWKIEVALNDRIAAVLAYDAQSSEHAFSIYENDDPARTNYVFRYGGKSTSIERSIRVFEFEGATAFLSMNALHIAAIVCHDGTRYVVDPNMPFVLVMPSNGFDVYDQSGNLLDLTQVAWYERTELQ